MTRPWIFQINTFEVNTRGSNRKMLSLVTDTHSKLSGATDPDIMMLHGLLDPVYNNYRQICIDYDVVAGNREGGTLAFEIVMAQIPQQLRIWESGVRAVHFEDSPIEKSIFPNKRGPFQTGTYEERVGAIGTLAQKLNGMAGLAATHALVLSFYNMALGTRVAQQQDEGALAQMSDLREQQRVIVADMLYGILGYLMFKHRSERDMIDNYFDLTLLRSVGDGGTPATMTLSGTVTHAVFGTVLGGVQVELLLASGTITVTTTATGQYVAPDIELSEAEDAQVRFSRAGFVDKVEDVTFVPGEDQELNVAMQVPSLPIPPAPPVP
jgi:hypothetical protein